MPSILECENLRKIGNITRNSKKAVGTTMCMYICASFIRGKQPEAPTRGQCDCNITKTAKNSYIFTKMMMLWRDDDDVGCSSGRLRGF